MTIYRDSEQMYAVMTTLFDKVLADPDGKKELAKNRMIFRLDISEPAGVITVDSKGQAPTVAYGPNQAKANLVIHTKAEVLHQVCTKQMRLADAFFGRKMQVEGSIWGAKKLENLFHVIQKYYPAIVREQGIIQAQP